MRRFLLIPLVALLLCCSAFAQHRNAVQSIGPTMILTGAVYDINGSVIVGEAKVVAYDTAGRKYESATSDEGFYKFELPLAVYKLEASAPGFCTARVERFKVVDATHGKMSLDFVLEVCPSIDTIQIPDKPRPKGKSKSKPIAE